MNKDLSYSAFNPEYSWHNKNIRLTARGSNDLLSVTNEKGNLSISFNEYFRDPTTTVYSYIPSFFGYVNTMEPPTYNYSPTFSNYTNVLVPRAYNYEATFSNYTNTLINI